MKVTTNKVMISGYCGNTPELEYTVNDVPFCKVKVATHEIRKLDENYIQTTQWHSAVFWREIALQAVLHIRRKDFIQIEGSLKYRSWQDSDGRAKASSEIWVNSFSLSHHFQQNSQERVEQSGETGFSTRSLQYQDCM